MPVKDIMTSRVIAVTPETYISDVIHIIEKDKISGLPVVDGCLTRKRESPPQARAETVAERRANVADAFSCRNQRLKDKPVLLIDDVATSGATLDACARAVKAGGASSVWGVVLAREI